MLKEFQALDTNHTLDLVPLPPNKKSISYKQVYKIKHKAYGSIEGIKLVWSFGVTPKKKGLTIMRLFLLLLNLLPSRFFFA